MATITATAEGQSGTADVEVIPDNFSPGADTNISGTQDFNEVNIPAGVTVTVTDDLVLNVAGNVTIDGTLSGDCVAIAINGDADVTIRGDVMNGCADGVTDLPDMSIVGDGDLTLDGGTIEYAGNLELSNDPTLDDSAFPAPGVPSGPDYYRAADASQAGDCRGFTHAFVPKPPKMAPGADGIVGGPGTDAKTWVLRCRGNAFIDGNVKVFGQDGGDGGKGTHEGALSANATGGPGGKGGKIRILVTGNLTFSGAGNEVVSGDGGAGGAALARGFFDVNPDPAWGATATGGAGAEPGLVDIRSTGGFIAIPGELTVRVGTGGAGGASDAFGGQGAHADERAAKPAQVGGDATAIGGLGGSSLQLKLQASGSVSGRANVDVEGGDGGKGGSTNADAGDGGDGNELFIDGAAGGILDATGGFGGDGLIRDLDDMPVSLGGDGGDLFVGGANGGFGWVDCIPPTFKKGGEGGPGGIVNGQRGEGGLGNKEDGEDGEVVISDITGNGGDGGDGLTEGGGGAGGIDLVDTPRIEAVGPNFEPGFPGIPCPVRTTRTTSLQLNQIPSTQGVVPAGTHVVDIIDDLTQLPVGTMPLTTLGPPNNHFFGSNPDRIGVSTLGGGSGHGWRLDVGNVDIPHDVEVEIVSLELCSINPIGIGPSNPMQIQLRDAGDNLVEQILINDPFAPGGAQQRPGCVGVMIPGEVAFVSLLIGQQAQVDMLPPDIDFFMLPPVAEQ